MEALDAQGPYPEDPLLSTGELHGNIQDLREQLPDATRQQLTDDETVVKIRPVELLRPRNPRSALEVFLQLTRSVTLASIGENGPAIASLGSAEEADDVMQNRFVAPHIRDALITARTRERHLKDGHIIERLRFPQLMRATLLHTAEQGGIIEEQFDPHRPFRQERPGKAMLVNFSNRTPVGRKFSRYAGWGHPIYVSVDAAPLFIAETSNFIQEEEPGFLNEAYTARDGVEHPIGQFYDLAVERLLADLHESPQGFLEFQNRDPRPGMGMLNQAWADSAGAYVHKNGEWANHEHGIAAVEVQGYAYDALRKAAEIYREKFDEPDKAAQLEERARKLQQDFLKAFFVTDEQGTFAAMGRDYDPNGNSRNLEVRHANMGLLLESGILDGDEPEMVARREAIIQTLFSPDMLTKYGVRSLSQAEKAYRPGGDHVGSIWPHINESIARGLIKHGYFGLGYYLRMANMQIHLESHVLPEYIRGDSTEEVRDNPQMIVAINRKYAHRPFMFEVPGQRMQGWTAEAVLAAKYAYSGLRSSRRFRTHLPIEAADPTKRAFEKQLLERAPR